MTEGRFDEVIHARDRLRVCGLLRPVDALSYRILADTLGLSSVTLSKHLKVLVEAGYVSIDKKASSERHDARRIAWVRLTRQGRRAFDEHVAMLREITAPPEGSVGAGPSPGPTAKHLTPTEVRG